MSDHFLAYTALGLPKNSELRDLFNYHLIRMRESGVFYQESHKWLREDRPREFTSTSADEAKALGLDSLLFPVLVLAAGISGCAILAMLEMGVSFVA